MDIGSLLCGLDDTVPGVTPICFISAWMDVIARVWYIYRGENNGYPQNQFLVVYTGMNSITICIFN